MRTLFALLGLTKHALANVYMSRNERRRVRGRALSFTRAALSAASSLASTAAALASDARAIGILCALGMRNFLHDAKKAFAREGAQDD